MRTRCQKWAAVTEQVIRIAVIWAAAMGIVAGSAHAQATATATERFVLSGVVFAGEGRGLAWLQEPTFTNNYVILVRPGDSVGPYRVTKILEDQVVLEGPGGTLAIPLAGVPGTATAAAGPGSSQGPASQAPLNKPKPIIIPPGDPRGNFPASAILVGAGAKITGPLANWKPPASKPKSVSPAQEMVAPATGETPAAGVSSSTGQSGTGQSVSGQRSQQAIIIPRGDPRRAFPASDFLIGAK
jgi:hypothetical protein